MPRLKPGSDPMFDAEGDASSPESEPLAERNAPNTYTALTDGTPSADEDKASSATPEATPGAPGVAVAVVRPAKEPVVSAEDSALTDFARSLAGRNLEKRIKRLDKIALKGENETNSLKAILALNEMTIGKSVAQKPLDSGRPTIKISGGGFMRAGGANILPPDYEPAKSSVAA